MSRYIESDERVREEFFLSSIAGRFFSDFFFSDLSISIRFFFREWSTVQQMIKEHQEFHQYFYECPEDIPWIDYDFGENNGSKIPYEVLETPEAETVFKNHVNALQQEQRRLE